MSSRPSGLHDKVVNGKTRTPARRKRKPRPSTARGLRTSTGCLTCRKRRVKCGEQRPVCANCAKSDRLCEYAIQSPQSESTRAEAHNANGHLVEALPLSQGVEAALGTAVTDDGFPSPLRANPLLQEPLEVQTFQHDSPATVRSSILDYDQIAGVLGLDPFGVAPYTWYDLLAADAIDDLQRHRVDGDSFWEFDETSLSRRRTPAPEEQVFDTASHGLEALEAPQAPILEPWKLTTRICLGEEEVRYFEHYVCAVAPILDLQDPDRHFANHVPHLALQNEGLLKSLLAVSARHIAVQREFRSRHQDGPGRDLDLGFDELSVPSASQTMQTATRYYYETLRYLSQNLLYPSYTESLELLATAINISTYEMFEAYISSNSRNWERHLQGSFFIQNHLHKENNAESSNGIRRAVWWAWMRQDVCAAFQAGRPAMTIFRPKKRLSDLDSDGLAVRIIWISAKCVQFAANTDGENINARIERGKGLLRMLDDWKQRLPSSFKPIETAAVMVPSDSMDSSMKSAALNSTIFHPIWIHPPSHAAATQIYHFSRIVVLIHETGTGGHAAHRAKERMLAESMETICGIALSQHSRNTPSAFVSLQALYAGMFWNRSKHEPLMNIYSWLVHSID